MNPEAAGVAAVGRRCTACGPTTTISTAAFVALFALDGDPAADLDSHRNRQLRQHRPGADDGLRGRTDGKGQIHPGPGAKYHNPGAFLHCKNFCPLGGPRLRNGRQRRRRRALTGHWPDPSGLLSTWLFDADRWAKDGYELWLKNVKLPKGFARREINTTLVQLGVERPTNISRLPRSWRPSRAWPRG